MKFSSKPKIIVLVPYPAQGHVTPMLQLALSLQTHGLQPVIVTPEFIHSKITSEGHDHDHSMDGISFLSIPDGLDAIVPRDFFTISSSMENNMPRHLEGILSSLCGRGEVVCVVVDLLASWAIEVARLCKIPVAGFWPAMLATYSLIKSIPDMIRLGHISKNGTPQNAQGAVYSLPGQPLLKAEDLPWLIGNTCQRELRFKFWLQALGRSTTLPWLLVNTFPGESFVKENHQQIQTQVFEVAPLARNSTRKSLSFWEEDTSCIDWLDDQKPNSVIYVSFGSWVSPIEQEKVTEMAFGLQNTVRPFIWVLGPQWRQGLPPGYLQSVSSYGKVVSWAPQKKVLQHHAVGCYITHCGWNSTMEAIECGKKLLCYPIAGDQFINCAYIVQVWKIGVNMEGFKRGDVEKGVRIVMEGGDKMQVRVGKLKERIMNKEGMLGARHRLTAFVDNLTKQALC